MSAFDWPKPDPLATDEQLIADVRKQTWRLAKENCDVNDDEKIKRMAVPIAVLATRCKELICDLVVSTWAAAVEGAEVGDMTMARSRLVALCDQIKLATPSKSGLSVERAYRELLDIARQIDHDGEVDDGILDSLHRVLANL